MYHFAMCVYIAIYLGHLVGPMYDTWCIHTWLCRMKMRMWKSLVFFSHSWKLKRFIVLISTVMSHHLLQCDVCVFSLNATCVWLSVIVHECLVGGYDSSSNELTYCGHR